jgi:photosystem II stability/assembly factor-like uncharacterized protein
MFRYASRWCVGLAVVGLLLVATRGDRSDPPASIRGFDQPDAATRYAAMRRAPVRADLDMATVYDRAAERRLTMQRYASRIDRSLPNLLPGRVSPTNVLDAWTPLGPGNVGGRTRVIRYHPTNHNIVFAAGVSGGVWKSEDEGTSWRPIAEGLANLAVNALAIDPRQPDTMYAGTGEGYFREEIRGTGLPLRGSGIFVTRDGGGSWQRLASTATDDFLWVNDLLLGIGDSRRLYAATRTGVWRSDDGGGRWSRLVSTTVRGGCLDLELRPDRDEDVLFASCGSYEPATVYRFASASTGSAPDTVLQQPGMGRTSLAIAPSNPDIVYALAASNDPGLGGNYRQGLLAVYRSDGGGAAGSWQARVTNTDASRMNTLLLTNISSATLEECGTSAKNDYTNMGWYNNVIAVDPRDPERVWAAGVDWFRSDDGGRTWGHASSQAGAEGAFPAYTHVDQHAITFHPDYDGQGNQQAIIGNDGGLYRTTNARGRTVTGPRAGCSSVIPTIEVRWQSLNHDYGVTQFYYGLPYQDGLHYLGGAQDNSTVIGSDQGGVNSWTFALGGDGGYVAVSPTDSRVVYAESQWANIGRSMDGGVRFSSAIAGLDPVVSSTLGPDANYLFVAPFVIDGNNSGRLWVGGEFLYRTTNSAVSWTKASAAMPDGGLVSTIAINPSDSNRVIAGTHKGHILSSNTALATTAASTWAATRARQGWVTSVAFDPKNSATIYATYGNFGGAHVYRSLDGGATWESLDGSGSAALPDIPAHCIVVDPDDSTRLYLGTDLGVFVSTDGGRRWLVEETGFGPAVTEWLALWRDVSGRKRLFAFTHGRGAWRVDLR